MTPEELGKLADDYWDAYNARIAADKVAESLKQKENQYFAQITNYLREQKLTAIGGQKVILEMHEEFVPGVKNWNEFYKHIQETGEFDLLEKRPGRVACRARWEIGVLVPGVEKFPVYKLSKSQVK